MTPAGDTVRVPVRLLERTTATDMRWVDSTDTWWLTGATRRVFTPDGREVLRPLALDTQLAVRPADLARGERDAERLTLTETRAHVESLRRTGVARLGRPLVELHEKVAYPFANIVLVLLGVPMAVRRRRGGQAAALAVGLVVAFAYLATERVLAPLGYAEVIPPAVAAWAPHVLFAIVAGIALVRAPR